MFRKSSYSGDTNCVEVDTDTPGVVYVRDSKVPVGTVLVFTRDEWRAFTRGVKANEFEVMRFT